MVIITGTGRSGTATLAKILGGHHEYRAGYILEKYFERADPHTDHFDTIEKRISVILDLHQGIDPGSFVDSSNLYIHFIDALYILNTDVKVILSVRHGKDFVRSAASRKWHERGTFGMVPPKGDPYFDLWNDMNPLRRNAWIWMFRNKKALRGLESIPEDRKLIVRIEDIGRPETLERLEDFASLKLKNRDLAQTRFNANPLFDFPDKLEWTDPMHREFEEIAGEMMKLLGYE
jgi:hypothetical protein